MCGCVCVFGGGGFGGGSDSTRAEGFVMLNAQGGALLTFDMFYSGEGVHCVRARTREKDEQTEERE